MSDELAAAMKRIAHLATVDDGFDALVAEMHKLANLTPYSVGMVCDPGTQLFRGTNHHVSMPTRIEEVWFPPADRLTTFGRANRPASPLFYCCSDPNGAFREIGTKLGHFAVLAKWENVRQFMLHDVGYSDASLKRAGATRALPERHATLYSKMTPTMREIRDYFALAFTDPTPSHYRVTVAIAEMFLACDGIAGIMYPAVEKFGNVDNLALLPQFVRTDLRLIAADAVYIDDVTGGVIGGTVVARLRSAEDGELLWEYTGESRSDIPPQSSGFLHFNHGERKRVITAGEMQLGPDRYAFEPGYTLELNGDKVVVRDLQGAIVRPLG